MYIHRKCKKYVLNACRLDLWDEMQSKIGVDGMSKDAMDHAIMRMRSRSSADKLNRRIISLVELS